MTYFMVTGDTVKVTDSNSVRVTERLEAKTYTVQIDGFGKFFLGEIDDMSVPSRVYGDIKKTADRVFSTFEKRPGATGILLSGEKGSGKTMLAKLLSEKGRAANMPTIIVQDSFSGTNFSKFLQDIDTPCIVVFDEFEKIYHGKQHEVLTLFDGVFPSKKLFIVTCNAVQRIDENMINRPGRMYYHLTYGGLDENFIRQYCDDVLVDKKRVDEVLKVSVLIDPFNFDLLQAIVAEMNAYNESAFDVIKFVNAKPTSINRFMRVEVTDDVGKKYQVNRKTSVINDPFNIEEELFVFNDKKENKRKAAGQSEDEEDESFSRNDILIKLYITGKDLNKVGVNDKSFTYVLPTNSVAGVKYFSVKYTPTDYSFDRGYGDI